MRQCQGTLFRNPILGHYRFIWALSMCIGAISIDGPASASYRDALFSVKPPKPIELGLAHFISHCRRLGLHTASASDNLA